MKKLLIFLILFWAVGIALVQAQSKYKLPFSPGQKFRCTRSTEHGAGTEYNAYDFAHETIGSDFSGTIICASRAGKVRRLRQDSNVGGCSSDHDSDANYIVIDHGDGEESLYLHFQYNSAMVALNDWVEAGQPIARVGNTGHSCGAHLHYQVQSSAGYSYWKQSLSTSFSDFSSNNGQPTAGSQCVSGAIPLTVNGDTFGGTVSSPKTLKLNFNISDANFTISNVNLGGNAIATSNVGAVSHSGTSGKFTLTIPANLSGLVDGKVYTLSFDVLVDGVVKYKAQQDVSFRHSSSIFTQEINKWYGKYLKNTSDAGLSYLKRVLKLMKLNQKRGELQNIFTPNAKITRGDAAEFIVNIAIDLGLYDFNTSYLNGYYEDVPPSHPQFSFIQTLRNKGYISTNAPYHINFLVEDYITAAEFVKILCNALQLNNASNETQLKSYQGPLISVSPDHDFKVYMDALNQIVVENKDENGYKNAEHLITGLFPITASTASQNPLVVVGDNYITYAMMNKIAANAHNFKKNGFTNISNYSIIGRKFEFPDLSDALTMPAPVVINQTINSGESADFGGYDAYSSDGNPLFYYWSASNGTIKSYNNRYTKIKFTAPVVSSTTQVTLYFWYSNINGTSREIYYTITVNPPTGGTSSVAPTMQVKSITTSNVKHNAMTVTVERGNGNKVLLVARENWGETMGYTPTDGQRFAVNPDFSVGDEMSKFNRWIILDNTNTVTITGLKPETSYSFIAFELNDDGTTRFLTSNPPQIQQKTTAVPKDATLTIRIRPTGAINYGRAILVGSSGHLMTDGETLQVSAGTHEFIGFDIEQYTGWVAPAQRVPITIAAGENKEITINYTEGACPASVVDFYFEPTQPMVGQAVSFRSNCNAETYKWTFQNANTPTSTQWNVYNVGFNTVGNQSVSLEIYNGTIGRTCKITKTVPVIALDATKPVGVIQIEGGAATTKVPYVAITGTANDVKGAVQYWQFSNDNGTTWSDWIWFQSPYINWNIGQGGSGIKTVTCRFKDEYGNISNPVSDNITLENTQAGSFIVRGKKFNSLRLANEYAQYGDVIYATAGYYDLTSDMEDSPYFKQDPNSRIVGLALKDGVKLMGEGAEKTIIQWNDYSTGLILNDNCTVQGITIIKPTGEAVIICGSNITISDCFIKGSDMPINHYASYTYGYSNISILRCAIFNNSSWINLCYINGVNFHNNIVYNTSLGVGITDGSNISFKNNVISNCGSDAISIRSTNVQFTNNNVWNNGTRNYPTNSAFLTNQTGINGNISVDPLYVNAPSGDFHLSSTSPCLNKGVYVNLPYYGTAPDMGCYESGAVGSLQISSNVGKFIITKPNGSTQTVTNPITLTGLAAGIYGVYPQSYNGYIQPNVQFFYVGNGTTAVYNQQYTADKEGPTGTINIFGFLAATQLRYVTIFVDVDDSNGLSEMKFSNDGTNWSPTEMISNRKRAWDLGAYGGNLNEGSKTIYAMFKDAIGNWSTPITCTFDYKPKGKLWKITTNDNFPNAVNLSQAGDIIFLDNGTHDKFFIREASYHTIKSGVALVGRNKTTTVLRTYMDFESGSITDNIFFNENSIVSKGILPHRISNSIFQANDYMRSQGGGLCLTNSTFKNLIDSDPFLLGFSSEQNVRFYNNVVDATTSFTYVSGQSGQKGIQLELNGGKESEIANNIFIGFNQGEMNMYEPQIYAAIYVVNDKHLPGEVKIRNNNFWNTTSDVYLNGSPITPQENSFHVNPLLTTEYKLPAISGLRNNGNNALKHNNGNGSQNTIGIEGGAYYNTPPKASALVSPQTGDLSTVFKFDASKSSDEQTPTQYLFYRWDFDGDGVFDTELLNTPLVEHQFTQATGTTVCWVFDEHGTCDYFEIPCPVQYNPPTAPTNLVVTALSSGSTRLTWTDNATNEINYVVERKLRTATEFFPIATLDVNSSTYTDIVDLLAGNTYIYRVKAVNIYDKISSNDVTVTLPAHYQIVLGKIPSSLCPNTPFDISVTTTGAFSSTNQFKAKLLPSGTVIATSIGNQTSILSGFIPSSIPAGNYQLLVESEDPIVSSIPSSEFTLNSILQASLTITANSTQIQAGEQVRVNASISNYGISQSYQWFLNQTQLSGTQSTLSLVPSNNDYLFCKPIITTLCGVQNPSSNFIVFKVSPSIYTQNYTIDKAGWYGISFNGTPEASTVLDILSPAGTALSVVQQGMSDLILWRDKNIFKSNVWTGEGLKVYFSAPTNFQITGQLPNTTSITLASGWSMLPVKSSCQVNTEDFLAENKTNVVIKEIGGEGLYWGKIGVNKLPYLKAGVAYNFYHNNSSPLTLTFPPCLASRGSEETNKVLAGFELNYTENSHLVGLSSEIVRQLEIGDVLLVRNAQGILCGVSEIKPSSENLAIVVVGKSAFSQSQGMNQGDKMFFSVYQPKNQSEQALELLFDGQSNCFYASNALSYATSLKTSSKPILESGLVQVYPVPCRGKLNLSSSSRQNYKIVLRSALGQALIQTTMDANLISIDVSSFAKGIYILEIESSSSFARKKIIID